jgi:hypothetical protein
MATFVVAGLILMSSTVIARAPSTQGSTWPYTGRLTDAAGQPVADGAYDFIFSLYANEKDTQALWTETQAGVKVTDGEISTALGVSVAIPALLSSKATYWLDVSVRGPDDTTFTPLNPRRSYSPESGITDSTKALDCPHNHFFDSWTGTNTGFGLQVDNSTGTGDGLRAYSASTLSNFAAVYAVNTAATGYGTAVFASSNLGSGVYASSGYGDAIEATTSSDFKSAIYAHSTNGNGVWAVSTNRYGVYGYSQNLWGGVGESTHGLGVRGYNDHDTSSAGDYGGYFMALNHTGAFLATMNPGSYYGAEVDGGLIITYGSCTGCKLAYVGLNNGTDALHPGDLVAAAGVKADAAGGDPILLVRLATQASDPVIGVVVSGASAPGDKTNPDKIQSSEIIPGAYVLIGTTGLYQVRVAGTAIAIGDYLAPGPSGAVVAADKSLGVAQAMTEPDADGLVWVMFKGN